MRKSLRLQFDGMFVQRERPDYRGRATPFRPAPSYIALTLSERSRQPVVSLLSVLSDEPGIDPADPHDWTQHKQWRLAAFFAWADAEPSFFELGPVDSYANQLEFSRADLQAAASMMRRVVGAGF